MNKLRAWFASETDGRSHLALEAGFAWLLVLATANLYRYDDVFFALWSLGRRGPITYAPYALVGLAFVAALARFAGIARRITGPIVCIAIAAIYALVPATYSNNLYTLWLMTVIVSLDPHPDYALRRWTDSRAGVRASLTLVPALVRAQVVIVYLGSVIVKCTHPWWQGTGRVIRQLAFEPLADTQLGFWNGPLRVLLANPRVAAVTDVCVVGAELVIPLLLMVRERRRIAFSLGAVLHLFMQEWLFPRLFTFTMLSAYYAFCPCGDRSWVVTFDPERASHRRLATVFARIDWLARTEWVSRAGTSRIGVRATDGFAMSGLAAVLVLSVLTPMPLWGFATFALVAPSVQWIGSVSRAAIENALVLAYGVAWVGALVAEVASGRKGPRDRVAA